jgi:hypothetical protein
MADNLIVWPPMLGLRHSGTLKRKKYIKECLNKILLKLSRQHNSSPLSWMNFTAIHCQHDVISQNEANNVTFVEKKHNPKNYQNFDQSNDTGHY